MSKNILVPIQTNEAPVVVGPYSQAIVVNEFVFCSGQIGIDPKTNEVVVGLERQTHQVMANLSAVLEASHSDLNHVLKTTIYLKDMKSYLIVNEIYGSYFTQNKPARATVEVSRLPKDVEIEIELIAITNNP